MTDLTEKWKKGELPSGWYYTKLWKGCNVIDKFIGNQFLRYDDSDIVEVIAPVPSYDENQQFKELLRECREELIPLWDELLFDYGYKTGNSSARLLRIDDLLNRIGNALGEKK